MERDYTGVLYQSKIPPTYSFFFFFSGSKSLSCAGCFILTTQLLMAYVLPSSSQACII